jgi:hypothetical protein
VEREPEKVSGAWLFKGRRVPVKALFENLEEGATVDDFLSWFPRGDTRAGTRRARICRAEPCRHLRINFNRNASAG